jgi:hypothetical protein
MAGEGIQLPPPAIFWPEYALPRQSLESLSSARVANFDAIAEIGLFGRRATRALE